MEKWFNGMLYGLLKPIVWLCNWVEELWFKLMGGEFIKQTLSSEIVIGVFIAMVALSSTALVIISIYKGVQVNAFYDEDKETPKHVAQNIAKGFTLMIMIYFVLMVFVFVFSLGADSGAGENAGLGQMLIEMGLPNGVPAEKAGEWSALFANNNIPTWDAVTKTLHVISDSGIGCAELCVCKNYNVLPALLTSLPVLVCLIYCLFIAIKRLFTVAMLFIVSPLPIATYPLNDGGGWENWYKDFISALLSGGIMYLVYLISGEFVKTFTTIIGTAVGEGSWKAVKVFIIPILTCSKFVLVIAMTQMICNMLGLKANMMSGVEAVKSGISKVKSVKEAYENHKMETEKNPDGTDSKLVKDTTQEKDRGYDKNGYPTSSTSSSGGSGGEEENKVMICGREATMGEQQLMGAGYDMESIRMGTKTFEEEEARIMSLNSSSLEESIAKLDNSINNLGTKLESQDSASPSNDKEEGGNSIMDSLKSYVMPTETEDNGAIADIDIQAQDITNIGNAVANANAELVASMAQGGDDIGVDTASKLDVQVDVLGGQNEELASQTITNPSEGEKVVLEANIEPQEGNTDNTKEQE